jgi:hypothetical protein
LRPGTGDQPGHDANARLAGEGDRHLERYGAVSDETGNEVFPLIIGAADLPTLGRNAEGTAARERERGRAMACVVATIHARQSREDSAFEWL